MFCGVLWLGAYNVLLNAAEQRIDAGTAAMLISVGPVILAALAGVLLGEGYPRSLVLGCGIALCGAVVIGLATSGDDGSGGLGAALCIAAAAAYAGGVIAQKPLLERTSALQITFLACAAGAAACLPFAPALVREAGDASAGALLWTRLPRRGPDRDRVHHLGVRAQADERRAARRDDLRGPADRDPARLDPARRDAAHARAGRRAAVPGRRRRRPRRARPAPRRARLDSRRRACDGLCMPAPRRVLALLLAAAAFGLAACGDSDSSDAQKAVDDLQQKSTDLQNKADDLADKVQDGKQSAEDAANEIQRQADDLGQEGRDQAEQALEKLKDKVPAGAKDDVQKAIDQLGG